MKEILSQTAQDRAAKSGINIYDSFWKEELKNVTEEQFKVLVESRYLSEVDAAWYYWETHTLSQSEKKKLKTAGITGPAPTDDILIKQKGDTELALEFMKNVPQEQEEDESTQSQVAAIASTIVSLLIKDDVQSSIKMFLTFARHMRPGATAKWGGLRKLGMYCGCTHASIHDTMKFWEAKLGTRTRQQRSDTYREQCKQRCTGKVKAKKEKVVKHIAQQFDLQIPVAAAGELKLV
jgi:hypothetical protein